MLNNQLDMNDVVYTLLYDISTIVRGCPNKIVLRAI